jgi:hypothetical protein
MSDTNVHGNVASVLWEALNNTSGDPVGPIKYCGSGGIKCHNYHYPPIVGTRHRCPECPDLDRCDQFFNFTRLRIETFIH